VSKEDPTSMMKQKYWDAKRMRDWVYRVFAFCVALALTISVVVVLRASFTSLQNLQTISTALLTVEGILLGLSPVMREAYQRVIIGFFSLMSMLFSLDTLILVGLVLQNPNGTVNTPIDVFMPYTITPLNVFYWNVGFFAASVIAYLGIGINADLELVKIKKRDLEKKAALS